MDWDKAQDWEKDWWSNCVNTLFEEEKQIIYAQKMGLDMVGNEKTPYVFDLHGQSVLDIGGGATSLLLKCINFTGTVVDPLSLPDWVSDRYREVKIDFWNVKAETLNNSFEVSPQVLHKLHRFDESWIYNCLSHCENPKEIIRNARKYSKLIRIFEWIDMPISEGHIHTLRENELNEWLNGEGKVEKMNTRSMRGTAYYSIVPTGL